MSLPRCFFFLFRFLASLVYDTQGFAFGEFFFAFSSPDFALKEVCSSPSSCLCVIAVARWRNCEKLETHVRMFADILADVLADLNFLLLLLFRTPLSFFALLKFVLSFNHH